MSDVIQLDKDLGTSVYICSQEIPPVMWVPNNLDPVSHALDQKCVPKVIPNILDVD